MGERVKGKAAIVTGAGASGPGMGNGKAAAILYAREGARVMLVDCNLAAAEETRRVIDQEGGECTVFQRDVTRAVDCQCMAAKCIEVFGRIDILHNNVGIPGIGDVLSTSEERWDEIMNINLKSMFLTCKYVLPQMEKQRSGAIVNISSITAIKRLQFPSVAYSVSKAGVIALTREIAIQHAARGVRANAVVPGYIRTPVMETAVTDAHAEDVEKIFKERADKIPVRKLGDAWDTAYAALFLASDEAKYVTGAVLVADGGLTEATKI
ncbi:MAG: SDR family NAD(P)-dependent oxidoreductase [Dehalococcoidales bacterium]|nr:SDR family NAD(P)-dependent oxidoreductase [Dehalococcoidales bacterium]MDP7109404.1 SDR family NAD(P)-dependent oxidoreductase [Dehalococcoidales bacterium]